MPGLVDSVCRVILVVRADDAITARFMRRGVPATNTTKEFNRYELLILSLHSSGLYNQTFFGCEECVAAWRQDPKMILTRGNPQARLTEEEEERQSGSPLRDGMDFSVFFAHSVRS